MPAFVLLCDEPLEVPGAAPEPGVTGVGVELQLVLLFAPLQVVEGGGMVTQVCEQFVST